ncbi:hypothetical protein PR202_gb11741 [Eleusine coracana subsp. coracana]|uniref:Pectinesterase n=1 Tax=Eleusine coracana subsp. coracana TaxID=191504 RepID=A0AAV5END8_ELECO|nr:hypothetical protein PR202_gb11741 [Eleusine coracana subsp. coracana]
MEARADVVVAQNGVIDVQVQQAAVGAGAAQRQMWVTSPAWAEKMLLQDTEAQADAVVAQDGTGDFTTISAAIAAAPQRSLKRHTIHVKRGVYDEIVRISKTTLNLKLVGDGMDVTVITGNSSVDLYTMQETATIGVDGPGFMAQDMTIRNTADEAHKFTVTSFIDGGSWLPETGVEFAPGL